MAIVSCPECSKKLKVADTSVGKKVKCTCGKVFVAETQDSAPTPVAAASDKVMVACSECGAKLKVAATSLGKKMKCPKCAAVFTAASMDEVAPPKKAPPPVVEADDGDVDPPAPVKKAKAVNEDDMEDLFSFAQKDGDKGADNDSPFVDEDEEAKPKAKGKKFDPTDQFEDDDAPPIPKGKKKPADDENDDKPKSKFGAKKGSKPSRDDDDAPAEKPVYPRRLVLNLFVFLLLFGFVAFFSVVFLGYVDLGLPKHNPKPTIPQKPKVPDEDDYKKLEGTWSVESLKVHDQELPAFKGVKFTFTEDKKTTFPSVKGAAYELDMTKTPKSITITTADKVTLLAVYELDEDKLQICTNDNNAKAKDKDGKEITQPSERPTKLDSHQGPLWVLVRDKKKDDDDKGKDKDKDKDSKTTASIEMSEIHKAFVRDAKAADDAYGGKVVEVSGQVLGVWEREYFSIGFAEKVVGNVTTTINCRVDSDQPEQIDKAARLSQGQKVKVSGQIRSRHVPKVGEDGKELKDFWIVFEIAKTTFIELEPSKLRMMSAADLAKDFEKDSASAEAKFKHAKDAPPPEVLVSGKIVKLDLDKSMPAFELEATAKTRVLIGTVSRQNLERYGPLRVGQTVEIRAMWQQFLDGQVLLQNGWVIKGTGGGEKDDGKNKNDQEAARLNGAWKVDRAEKDGESDKELIGAIYTFSEDMKFDAFGLTLNATPFKVDASKNPKEIDVQTGKVTLQGIYKFDGDDLHLCFGVLKAPPIDDTSAPRPTAFDSKKGLLLSLKRDKKGVTKKKETDKDTGYDQAHIDVARIQAQTLTKAVNAYAVKNAGKFPASLDELLKKDATGAGPYLEGPETLLDPWKKPYQYEPAGTKNGGLHPDIWTVAPDKQVIGNWPKEKAKPKEADKDKDADPKDKKALTNVVLADFAGTWKSNGFFIKGKGLLIEKLELSIQPDGKSNVAYKEKSGSDFKLSAAEFRVRHEKVKNDQAKTETSVTMIDSFLGLQWLLMLESKTKLKLIAIIPGETAPKIEEFILTRVDDQVEPKRGKEKVVATPLARVEGTVTLDGKPLVRGEIEFEIADYPAKTLEIKDGSYSGQAFVGKNAVRIHVYKDGPPLATDPDKKPTRVEALPEKYNSRSTLVAEVSAKGPNEFQWQLTSK